MDHSVILLVLVSLTYSSPVSSESDTALETFSCGNQSLDLRCPFSSNLIHDSFEFHMFCKANSSMIKFPCYGELGVKAISYNPRKLDLIDPKNCVHEVFLNLDLSQTHFSYYYLVKNYTYLNCSSRLPAPVFERIPCLSGTDHHVYTVDQHTKVMPDCSCRILKTVAIPFSYSPYLADSSFGLGLSWDLPEIDAKGLQQSAPSFKSWHTMVMCFGILTVAMAATLPIGFLVYLSKKNTRRETKNSTDEITMLLENI